MYSQHSTIYNLYELNMYIYMYAHTYIQYIYVTGNAYNSMNHSTRYV